MNTANQYDYDVIVLGGGASGMMAALTAAREGARVLLVEKNKRLGEKLRITGGGRCNILNAEYDLRTLLKNYGKSEKYLFSIFSKFGVAETIRFFSEIGIEIKIEARNRAFPLSERAEDVANALEQAMQSSGVEVMNSCAVRSLSTKSGTITGVDCGGKIYKAKSYILATGGLSHPETGSTGDGFKWLEDFGHNVNSPSPSITPIKLHNKWVKNVSGVSVKSAEISFASKGKRIFKSRGDLIFTHFGVSGPAILNSSQRVGELLDIGPVTASLDLLPDHSEQEVDAMIQNVLDDNGKKLLKNIMSQFCPVGTSTIIRESLKTLVNFELKSSEVDRVTRKNLVLALKQTELSVDGLMGMEKAVVADGGVSLKDIDMRTMRSLKQDNLFVTGDLLDITRPSGGFSLQLCWTTGYIAGISAVNRNNLDFNDLSKASFKL